MDMSGGMTHHADAMNGMSHGEIKVLVGVSGRAPLLEIECARESEQLSEYKQIPFKIKKISYNEDCKLQMKL
ncbi:hypothetical protein [Burkholderia pseudomallei]|uniref:hypothetical protein n=1 Tax=Burkholderia pseudomallei TaxID=28450 RepID=UPI001178A224|nr:hypothetical protein [Burkholderia pseudomallei]